MISSRLALALLCSSSLLTEAAPSKSKHALSNIQTTKEHHGVPIAYIPEADTAFSPLTLAVSNWKTAVKKGDEFETLTSAVISEDSDTIMDISMTVDRPIDIMLAKLRISVSDGTSEETFSYAIDSLQNYCPVGGVKHRFQCSSGTMITLKGIVLPNEWPESFAGRVNVARVEIISAGKTPETLLSLSFFASFD